VVGFEKVQTSTFCRFMSVLIEGSSAIIGMVENYKAYHCCARFLNAYDMGF